MNSTNALMRAVESSACDSSGSVSRRRASAISSAPVAPMAPPSVGVAMPRKMVPSTRKISASGGTSTSSARRASCAPDNVRADAGSAGAHSGRAMVTPAA
jgi:hypothetical protein